MPSSSHKHGHTLTCCTWIIAPALEAVGFDHVTVCAGTLFVLLLEAREPTGRPHIFTVTHTHTHRNHTADVSQ